MEKFLPTLFLRAPLYSYNYKNTNSSEFLSDERFKTAVFLASRSFFEELKKKGFQYGSLSHKQKQALKKYINRSVFRSTPFGLFSSFSLVRWQEEEHSSDIILDDPFLNVKLDFAALQRLWERLLKNEKGPGVKFMTNQSFHFNPIDFRYLKKEIRGEDASFSVVSVAKSRSIKTLLTYCNKGKTYDEILSFLQERFATSAEDAGSFINELIKEQILLPDTSPSVTGTDYGDLFLRHLDKCCENFQVEKLKIHLACLSLLQAKADSLALLSDFLDEYLTEHTNSDYFYSTSKREVCHGSLSIYYQQGIKEGLNCLDKLCKTSEPADLQKFKEAFTAKYEFQEVPLLQALDSQFGVGYGDFEQLKLNYGFSSGYLNSSNTPATSNGKEGELAALLMKEWQIKKDFNWKSEIEITDEHLNRLPKNTAEKLPPSLSVMFRPLGEKIFIESAGGVSALSLIGRFTHHKDSHGHAERIGKLEQKFNPGVVFAEIAHSSHLHTSNINRRPHFYDYEIPVLTNSVMPPGRQIPLNDILISVLEGSVILRSKKLNKRIIPRLSSALNYTKSSFPIFRFLCDVQYQNLKTNFNFSLSNLLPGLQFYPRVSYKSCVLQLAEWHLHHSELEIFQDKAQPEAFLEFQRFRKRLNLPRYFTYAVSDNFLVFDSTSQEDVMFFLKEISSK